MAAPILIVDLHSCLHNIKHGIAKSEILSYKGNPTFIIYGFITKLRAIMEKIPNNMVVFACDSKKSKRLELFPKYKEKRTEKTPDQIELDNISYPQFDIIKNEVLPTLGFRNIFEFDGYEGDDIIAQIVLKDYSNHYCTFCTTDEDMYQLLSDRAWMLKHSTMKIYSKSDFIEEYGIQPQDWKKVKSWGGCNSDGVPGLRVFIDGKMSKTGIGTGKALAYVKGEMKPGSNSFKAFTDPKNKAQLQMNKSLVILPFKGTPSCRITRNEMSAVGLRKIAERYGFKSILKDFVAYQRVFGLI